MLSLQARKGSLSTMLIRLSTTATKFGALEIRTASDVDDFSTLLGAFSTVSLSQVLDSATSFVSCTQDRRHFPLVIPIHISFQKLRAYDTT